MAVQGVSLLIGSVVFLVLYAALEIALLIGYITGTFKLKSRWSFLLFHTTLRLAAQSVAIAFAVLGYSASGALVAYVVLAAEGLCLCAYRWLIVHHEAAYARHESFLEPRRQEGARWYQRLRAALSPRTFKPMTLIHYLLIVANALIISGSTRLSSAFDGPNGAFDPSSTNVAIARALAGTGQSIFFLMILGFGVALVYTMRRMSVPELGKIHWTLIILAHVTPLLVVRGVFGILQAVDLDQSFASRDTYGPTGLHGEFVAKEYCLAALMEWLSACLLLGTWWTSREDDAIAIQHAHDHELGDGKTPPGQDNVHELDKIPRDTL